MKAILSYYAAVSAMFLSVSLVHGQAEIGTHMGMGADGTIANDEPGIDPETGEPNTTNQFFADDQRGLANTIEMRMFQDDLTFSIIRHRVGLLRFDLSQVSGDVSDAYLEFHSINQGRLIDFYVLNDTNTPGVEDWDEATISYNTAPGLLGPQPYPTNYVNLDHSALSFIGSWAVPGPQSGDGFPVNFTVVSQPTPTEGAAPGKIYDDGIAESFSENLSAAIAADTNNLITLIMVLTGADDPGYGGNNGNVEILTKEGLQADMVAEQPLNFWKNPTLVLPHAELLEPGGLDGDYNEDGIVDGHDFLVWQREFGNNVAPGSGADGSGNGVVDGADLTIWEENFGAIPAAAIMAVPEPSTVVLIAMGTLCLNLRRRTE